MSKKNTNIEHLSGNRRFFDPNCLERAPSGLLVPKPIKSMEIINFGGTANSVINPKFDGVEVTTFPYYRDLLTDQRRYVLPDYKDNISFRTVAAKNSTDISENDITLLAQAVKVSNQETIIINCGLFNIDKLRSNLEKKLEGYISHKKIVLWGSMLSPELAHSDAPANFGAAVAAGQLIKPGIVVCMRNGVMSSTSDFRSLAEQRLADDGIAIFDMGGTIEGTWNAAADTASTVSGVNSFVEQYIRSQLRIVQDLRYKEIIRMDSRDLNDLWRTQLLESISLEVRGVIGSDGIKTMNTKNFVIPHGTYTKAETARFVMEHVDAHVKNATIVFLSAMVPLSYGAYNGDAGFNVGYALMASTMLPPGVYISANSRIYDPASTDKDLSNARFMNRRYAPDEEVIYRRAINSYPAKDKVVNLISQILGEMTDKQIEDIKYMNPDELKKWAFNNDFANPSSRK
ncbi:MAG: asparaginase domain-containing protein [Firmicutes bacterium]|nr:asparaginase domain-containing protein [Bacillota bacterium]